MVVLLWVIAVYLLPRLADLLHDQEARFCLDDPFDLPFFVSGDYDEVITLAYDRGISGRQDLDGLKARSTAAFAVERQRPRDCVLLGARFDPLVDPAEDLFVSRGSLGEVHRRDPISLLSGRRRRAQSAERLLQKRGTFVAVGFAPNDLSPLAPGAALDRHGNRVPTVIDAAASIGTHAPLLVLAPGTEGDCKQHIMIGCIAAHT